MKKLLYLGIVLILGSCGSSTVNVDEREVSTIKREVSTIKIGDLEVMTEDLGKMNWYEAKKACKNLGDGWRLPTKDELNLLFQNSGKIGGFASDGYWSSTEYGSSNAWTQYFGYGVQGNFNKGNYNFVRAVRGFYHIDPELKSRGAGEVSTIKIGDLEVMTEDLGKMNWYEAKKACKNLGDGWRLPTKDELNLLFQNSGKIGGFASDGYWSSTEYGSSNAWTQYFFIGSQNDANKDGNYSVRAVRAF